jgi:putative colanic acid biosynthesis UDP-glucose lipid carrier transferase
MDGGHGLSASAGPRIRLAAADSVIPEAVFPQAFRPPPLQERHGQAARQRTSAPTTGKVGGPMKRVFDIAASGVALLVLSPILAGIWLAVRLESRGPGFFRQRRGGFQGRPFYIYKLRTMRTCEDRTIAQAKEADDRTTRLGRFLRKNSIDELPQLINVLLGDMSIVGPRPHALAHDRQFSTLDRRYCGRHHARPGITGLAQVSGARGPTDTHEKIMQRMQYDLRYVADWSWGMDISILIRTVLVVVRDRNVF